MNKKIFMILLSVFILFSSVSPVDASGSNLSTIGSQRITLFNPCFEDYEEINAASVMTFSDGSQLIISKATTDTFNKENSNVTGTKHADFAKDGILLWRVTLTASFDYNGVSATCTTANSVTQVYQGNWSESSNNTYPSGNTAVAYVTVVRKVLFIVVETQNVTLSITCDGNGHVS
ncbi:MAG: hypothetical protein IJK86_04895 [Lachnospiraceae bacterium]|nr:hypothetical protein [Lachnospiraceae bacterium]